MGLAEIDFLESRMNFHAEISRIRWCRDHPCVTAASQRSVNVWMIALRNKYGVIVMHNIGSFVIAVQDQLHAKARIQSKEDVCFRFIVVLMRGIATPFSERIFNV